MGMYTELLIKAEVRKDAPQEVHDILSFLFNRGTAQPPVLPGHAFFTLSRWANIGGCSSFYHVPFASGGYREGYLFSRSDLKNYDGEIEAFLDWIMPYVDEYDGRCIGWTWYEEADAPTLIEARAAERG